MDRALTISLHGSVQGVGLRWAVSQQARLNQLRGFVRNNVDGSVTIGLEGSEAALRSFLKWLHNNPSAAVIERLQPRWGTATGRYDTFNVEHLD